MALVINDRGETVYRQAKIQLVGGDTGWAAPGNRMGLFRIDDDTCSLIICHDSRYPELVRLPVIKGSRLVFYLSNESGIKEEHKIDPYRAQVVARAVENNVYVVQSNAPQTLTPLEGSHGQSRIVAPDGTLLQEASILGEEVLIEVLDLKSSTGNLARKSLRAKFLREWWKGGLDKIEGFQ
jgi:predicted amidohydrolase